MILNKIVFFIKFWEDQNLTYMYSYYIYIIILNNSFCPLSMHLQETKITIIRIT